MQLSLFDSVSRYAGGSFRAACDALGIGEGPGWTDRFGDALSSWMIEAGERPIRTLSLFAGAGGLDIGFHDAGFRIEQAVEIDERFAATLRANSLGYLGGTEVLCQDVRSFAPVAAGAVDFIIGGPPCQSFSAAGRRAAGVRGTQDDRGTLFQEYVRLLGALRPAGFLFENVYGITGAEQGKAWQAIQGAFQAAGYRIAARILDAADYGVPQHRERMFIVGTREGGFRFPAPTHGPDASDPLPHFGAAEAVLGAPLSDKERHAVVRGRFGHLLAEVPPGLNYSFFTEKMGHPRPIFAWRSKFSDFLYKADPTVPVRTLKAQAGQYTGPFHWDNRPFSIAELKRLQTFPDRYVLAGSRQVAIQQIGNSVPPQLARVLALAIRDQVFARRVPVVFPLLAAGQELGFRKRKRALTAVYRDKAAAGIKDGAAPIKVSSRSYRAKLGDGFGWVEDGSGALAVSCDQAAQGWMIRIDGSASGLLIEIDRTADWALGERTVRLAAPQVPEAFVAAWKAFDAALAGSGIKADLVQLCEYYQYAPRFRCRMTIEDDADARWRIVKRVVEGAATREILAGHQIARLWGCEEREVLGHMRWLRSLAYEVRNSRTNPQIPEGSYLIPYAFPTLTPLSVQLRKSLVAP